MNRRHTSSLLWGLVGTLTFLVGALGHLLLVGPLPVGGVGIASVGLLIGVVVATVSYAVEPRLAAAVGR
jgi:hypothetical protein